MKKILTATLILSAASQPLSATAATAYRRVLAQVTPTTTLPAVVDPLADEPEAKPAVAAPYQQQRAGVVPSSAGGLAPYTNANAIPQLTSASSGGSSTVQVAQPARTKVSFGYDGGTASLTNLRSNESPTDFDVTGGGAVQHRLFTSVEYKLSQNVAIAPQVGVLITGRADKSGPSQVLDTPFVTLKLKNLVKTSSYNLSGAFRTYLGLTTAMHDQSKIASFRYLLAQTLSVPNTKISLGLETYLQGSMYRETIATSQRIRAYANPTVSYQATSDTAVGLSYEIKGTNLMGDPNIFTYAYEADAFQTFLNTNLTPNLNLNTGLDFKSHGRINMDTTQLFATLIWTVN